MSKTFGNGMHIENYGMKDHDPVNPLIPIIEDMFSHELHESSWKNYTVEKTIDLLKKKMKEKGLALTERHYVLLRKKLGKCTKMEQCLVVLTNNMLGQVEDV
jgi:hypothetical protein